MPFLIFQATVNHDVLMVVNARAMIAYVRRDTLEIVVKIVSLFRNKAKNVCNIFHNLSQ